MAKRCEVLSLYCTKFMAAVQESLITDRCNAFSLFTPGGIPTLAGGTYLGWGIPTLTLACLPWPWGTYLGSGVPTLARGYSMMGVHPIQGWGTPCQGWGTSLPQDRTTDGVLDTPRLPLAFTQEDFLVLEIALKIFEKACLKHIGQVLFDS